MSTIEDQFHRFHRDHPDVYEEFVRIARRLIAQGRRHWSADAICHVIRFNRAIAGRDEMGFKINNNYTALYARMAMEQNEDIDGFFQTRERKAA